MGVNITRVLGIFNVIDCKEETWKVTSHEFWGYLMGLAVMKKCGTQHHTSPGGI